MSVAGAEPMRTLAKIDNRDCEGREESDVNFKDTHQMKSVKRLIAVGKKLATCVSKMTETSNDSLKKKLDAVISKRACGESQSEVPPIKKQKSQESTEETGAATRPYRKKKMALLMMFCGKDYYGMQKNPGQVTVESFLFDSLLKAGVVTQDHVDSPGKMRYQRASRTDKGVSCVGQVVSLKINVENAVQKINKALPAQIQVLEAIQTTKGFDAKLKADARTYSYTMPTFAFTPQTEQISEDFRVTKETLEKLNRILDLFKGTHNFYNYTSGRAVTDKSCLRYIMEFHVSEPFIKEGLEFVVVHVKGQSFMLHQIRKMIGMAVAVVQGLVSEDYVELSWGPERVDVPKAPGVGLVLEEVHYYYYNEKFGHDGLHESISFDRHKEKIDLFKDKYIYPNMVEAETEEKSMFNWLISLREKHFRDDPLKDKAESGEKVQEQEENSKDAAENEEKGADTAEQT